MRVRLCSGGHSSRRRGPSQATAVGSASHPLPAQPSRTRGLPKTECRPPSRGAGRSRIARLRSRRRRRRYHRPAPKSPTSQPRGSASTGRAPWTTAGSCTSWQSEAATSRLRPPVCFQHRQASDRTPSEPARLPTSCSSPRSAPTRRARRVTVRSSRSAPRPPTGERRRRWQRAPAPRRRTSGRGSDSTPHSCFPMPRAGPRRRSATSRSRLSASISRGEAAQRRRSRVAISRSPAAVTRCGRVSRRSVRDAGASAASASVLRECSCSHAGCPPRTRRQTSGGSVSAGRQKSP